MTERKLIAIVGGIAVGKTTIGNKLLQNNERIEFIEEDVSQNEFLEDFYKDMKCWAFHSRISTLAMIAANYLVSDNHKDIILMDRCLDELITFARLQFEKGNLSEREFRVYSQLYHEMVSFAPKIDGYIYCYCDSNVSLERIRKRNRKFEQAIDLDYLNNLNREYDKWIKSMEPKKVLYIDTEETIDTEQMMKFISEL